MRSDYVTEQVRKLYDAVPYTAYGEDYFPVVKSLNMSREEFAAFAKGKSALEVGCGGGQLSVFLARFFSSVIGIDISSQSLKRAQKEASKRHIGNLKFVEGDLLDRAFISAYEGGFDFVLCYGVLHHTPDPFAGFAQLTKLLKPGGVLVVGVYSRTMLKYRLRRKWVLFRAGGDWARREKLARRLFFKNGRNEVGIYDGYVHPQVSFHSITEVFNWLKSNHLAYLGSWPPIELPAILALAFKRASRKIYGPMSYNNFMFLIVELLWLASGKSVMLSLAGKKL